MAFPAPKVFISNPLGYTGPGNLQAGFIGLFIGYKLPPNPNNYSVYTTWLSYGFVLVCWWSRSYFVRTSSVPRSLITRHDQEETGSGPQQDR